MYLCVKGRNGFWLDGVNELVSKGGSDELERVCTCLAEGLVVGGLFLVHILIIFTFLLFSYCAFLGLSCKSEKAVYVYIGKRRKNEQTRCS